MNKLLNFSRVFILLLFLSSCVGLSPEQFHLTKFVELENDGIDIYLQPKQNKLLVFSDLQFFTISIEEKIFDDIGRPPVQRIHTMCGSQTMWVLPQQPNNFIVRYDFEASAWVQFALPEEHTYLRCKELESKLVVTYDEGALILENEGDWQSVDFGNLSVRDLVFEGETNRLWAITPLGQIYLLNNNLVWQKVTQIPSEGKTSQLLYQGNKLWVNFYNWKLKKDQIYVYDLSQEDLPEVIGETDSLAIIEIFSVPNDQEWIVTTDGIFSYTSNTSKLLKLSPDIGFITGAFYDETMQRLYVASEEAIYTLDFYSSEN